MGRGGTHPLWTKDICENSTLAKLRNNDDNSGITMLDDR